jgi:erythrin-vacuolar iron transport family protein
MFGRPHATIRNCRSRRHGLVFGAMTALGGIGHTLTFLIPRLHAAMTIAFLVVLVEFAVITWIRHRYMETPIMSAATQVALGGALVFGNRVLIGSS